MKKIVISTITILAFLLIAFNANSANFPSPKGHVNDIANLIESNVEQRIEAQLSNYEKQTSIEIAVVTTSSLDGRSIEGWTMDLAMKWGVGKRGKDNGVLFVIAPNERKCRIEVGYGLEGDLPDGKAGMIIDYTIIPKFKSGDYQGGIVAGVNEIINKLGTMTPQQRAEEKQRKLQAEAQAREEATANFKAFMLIMLVIGGVVLVLFCIYKAVIAIRAAIREYQRKKLLREKVVNGIFETKKKAKEISENSRKLKYEAKHFPSWASVRAFSLLAGTETILDFVSNYHKKIRENLKEFPDSAKTILDELESKLALAESHLKKIEEDIPHEIAQHEKNAENNILGVTEKIKTADEKLKEHLKLGFRLPSEILEEFNSYKDKFKKNKDSFASDKKEAKKVNESLETLDGCLRSFCHLIDNTQQVKKVVDKKLSELPGRIENVENDLPKHVAVFEEIKKNYPEENWKNLASSLALTVGFVAMAKKWVASAKEKNTMEKQDFLCAKNEVETAEDNLRKVGEIAFQIRNQKKELEKAKSSYKSEYNSAENLVSKAKRKVKDSDVGRTAKSKAREAEEKFLQARSAAETSGLINWLLVILLLSQSAELASNAIRKAQSDIDDAEAERRRKKREEEEEEARRRRRRNSSSSYSYGGSSSSSSSSFGGFGGGSFGGGGASGSW